MSGRTRTLSFSGDFVRRALSGHAAVGLLAGGLLYILCLSGSLIVLEQEWRRWEQPDVPEMTRIAPEAVQAGIAQVLASVTDKKSAGALRVELPSAALPRTTVSTQDRAVYLDEAGRVVAPERHGWTDFLFELHAHFHLPAVLGLSVVGALGVMMAVLTLGGVLAHPRIFRDAFRLRTHGAPQLAYADWHNRLGVWTLPFGFALSVTGALLGLASILALILATFFYNGDRSQVFGPIFGSTPAGDSRAAPLADSAEALRHMAREEPGVRPALLIVHEPGTRGQYIQLLAEHPRRLILGDYYLFDALGQYRGKVGLSDGELGQQAAASVYKLHFGSFGDLPVKLGYLLFGLALAVISATGTHLWLIKRRQRGLRAPRLEAMWTTIVWGVPLLIAGAYLLRFVAGAEAPLAGFFWTALFLLLIGANTFAQPAILSLWLREGLGGTLLVVAIAHLITWKPSSSGIAGIDVVLLLAGVALIPKNRFRSERLWPRAKRAAD